MVRIGIVDVFKGKKKEELDLPDIEEGSIPGLVDEEKIQQETPGTEMQILIAKLDLINARLQNIEQRLNNLEQIARQAQQQQGRW